MDHLSYVLWSLSNKLSARSAVAADFFDDS